MKKRAKANKSHKGKTAQANYEEIQSDYPEAREMMNIQFDKPYLPDPFDKTAGQAARMVSREGKT